MKAPLYVRALSPAEKEIIEAGLRSSDAFTLQPKWVHGKRAIVEPARLLTAKELRQRVCDYFSREQTELLTQKVS
jgi:hypothetical protein